MISFENAGHAVLLGALATASVCVTAQSNDSSVQTAEANESGFEETVVRATRLQQQAWQTGTAVHVIDADVLQRQGFQYVVDALATAPGVTVNQNGTYGGVASVRIRGALSEQTLVLVDGVVVNDATAPGGGFDFARLDPATVERIEVLNGPQSTLWGSDAIGGVISITTRQPTENTGGSVFVEGGSFQTWRGGLDLHASHARGDVRLNVLHTDTDGISKADEDNGNDEEDGYQATSVSVAGGINLPKDARLDVSWNSSRADSEFDAFDFTAQGSVADGDQLSETREYATSATLSVPLQIPRWDGSFVNQLLIGHRALDRESFTNGLPSNDASGDRTIFRYQGTLAVNTMHQFAFGAERENVETSTDETTLDGLFLLYELTPVDNLTLSMGVRSDDLDDFGRETTSRAAVAWQPLEMLTLRASWGEGFKAPTLFQQTFFCCGALAPNPDLVPEESTSFDIGADFRSSNGKGFASLTLFTQDTENLITFSFVAGGYENIAESESRGVELAFGYQFMPWFSIEGSYAYIDAVDDNDDRLIRVPEHSGDVNFIVDPKGPLSLNLLVRYNGEERDFSESLDRWTRVDLAARYTLFERYELFGRIENLLDADYQQVLGYGTPGISFTGGMRVRF